MSPHSFPRSLSISRLVRSRSQVSPWFLDYIHWVYLVSLRRGNSSIFVSKTAPFPFIHDNSLVLETEWETRECIASSAQLPTIDQSHSVCPKPVSVFKGWTETSIWPKNKSFIACKEKSSFVKKKKKNKVFSKLEHKCLFKTIFKLWFRGKTPGAQLNPTGTSTCQSSGLEKKKGFNGGDFKTMCPQVELRKL